MLEDPLPPAVQALHQQLLDDAAAWSRTVPPLPGIAGYVSMLMRERLPESSVFQESPNNTATLPPEMAHHSAEPDAASEMDEQAELVLETQRMRRGQWQHERFTHLAYHPKGRQDMRQSHLRILATFASLAAVVLLIIGVLHFANGRATPAPASGTQGIIGQSPTWTVDRQLIDTNGAIGAGAPAIAASNPRIVYETSNHMSSNGVWSPVLRRTADGGLTWQSLPLPMSGANLDQIAAYVSATNPNIVLLVVDDQVPSSDMCPTAENQPVGDIGSSPTTATMAMFSSGGPPCPMQFISTDGGQHWLQLHLQSGLHLIGDQYNNSEIIRSRGKWIYGLAACWQSICGERLVGSADGGATWQDLSSGLDATLLCDALPATTGNALYATTALNQDCASRGECRLWRSSEDGATWQPIGTAPACSFAVAPGETGSGQIVIYVENQVILSPLSTNNHSLWASLDDGATWVAAPMSGLRPRDSFIAAFTVTSDDRVVATFANLDEALFGSATVSDLKNSLYAWKAGDTSWRPLTYGQPLSTLAYIMASPSSGGGHDTLWCVSAPVDDTAEHAAYTIYSYQLP